MRPDLSLSVSFTFVASRSLAVVLLSVSALVGPVGCSSTTASDAGASADAGADSSSATDGGRPLPGAPVDPKSFCDAWAKVCPKDAARVPDAVATCKTNCEQGQLMTTEDCSFPACSVETGKCDNDEKGDPSILACIVAHGWVKGGGKDAGSPCQRAESLDSSCASQSKPGKAYLCGSPGLTPGIAGCVNGATNGVANGTFCCP